MALFVSGVGVVCEEVVARDHVLRQVRVVVGDTSVDDGDLDATATGGDVPGLGRVDVVVARLIQAPKLAEPRVVRTRRSLVDVVRLRVEHLAFSLELADALLNRHPGWQGEEPRARGLGATVFARLPSCGEPMRGPRDRRSL